MGFVALAAIGLLVVVLIWRLGVARPLWTLLGAGLLLAATGYALQGRPTLAGHPVAADSQPIDIDPQLVAFREAIMPGLPGDAAALALADDRLRQGDPTGAVTGLLDAIAARPRDSALWTGLGTVLAAHDGQQLSPTALFAFRRAFQLAPDQPAPAFFLGLASVQAGDIAAAKPAWQQALALTPRDAPYRNDIAERLAMIDAFLAIDARRRPGR